MASFTIDATNRIIILDQVAPVSGVVTLDVATDLYSECKGSWKDTTNQGGLIFPFVAVGGQPYGGDRYKGTDYFLLNNLGWRIRPYEGDHELQIIGNLRPWDTNYPVFVPTLGNYTVYAPQERSGVFEVQKLDSLNDNIIDVLKLNGNKVTTVGDILTIYENDGITVWKEFNIANTGRVEI